MAVVVACGQGCSMWWWWWWRLVSSLLVMINRNFERKLPGHERRSGRLCPCGVIGCCRACCRRGMVTSTSWCGGCNVWWWWWWWLLVSSSVMIDRNFKTKKYQGTNDIQVVRAHVGLLVVVELVAATSRYGHGDMVWWWLWW